MGKKKVAKQAEMFFQDVEIRQKEFHYEKQSAKKDQDVSHLGLNAGNFGDYIKSTRGNRLKG